MWGWLGSWALGISVETGYGVRRDSVVDTLGTLGSIFFVIFNFARRLVAVQFLRLKIETWEKKME